MRIEAPIQKLFQGLRQTKICHMSSVMCHGSCVTCHLSPVTNANSHSCSPKPYQCYPQLCSMHQKYNFSPKTLNIVQQKVSLFCNLTNTVFKQKSPGQVVRDPGQGDKHTNTSNYKQTSKLLD